MTIQRQTWIKEHVTLSWLGCRQTDDGERDLALFACSPVKRNSTNGISRRSFKSGRGPYWTVVHSNGFGISSQGPQVILFGWLLFLGATAVEAKGTSRVTNARPL
jgi:hypothetical protein